MGAVSESELFSLLSGAAQAVQSISCTRNTFVGQSDPQGPDEISSSCQLLSDGRFRYSGRHGTVLFDGSVYWFLHAPDGRQVVRSAGPLPNPLHGLISPAWLSPGLRFVESGTVDVDGVRCRGVQVYTPAADGLERGALLYTLAVDAEYGVIMRLRDEREDYETELADVAINTVLDQDLFRPDLAPGATIVDPTQQFAMPGPATIARAFLRQVFRKDA